MAPPKQKIDLGYRPRSQFVPFHRRKQRWACIVAHRRAGKSVACIMDLIDGALRCKKTDGRFSYVGPTYTQTKATIWMYLKRFTAGIPGIEQRESDLMVILPNGAQVRLFGADNFERLRGSYSDALVVDEYADIDPRAWPEVLRPSLADRGGSAVFIGTPKGRNDFYRLHEHAQNDPDWFSLVLKASETHLLPQSELDDIRGMLTPEAFAAEMECSFDAAILGAYFAKELDDAQAAGRMTSALYDPTLPVHTAWDLGIGDSTAIWFFQVSRAEVRAIDYYEASGLRACCALRRRAGFPGLHLRHGLPAARRPGTPTRHRPLALGDAARPDGPHTACAAATESDGRHQRRPRHHRLVLV